MPRVPRYSYPCRAPHVHGDNVAVTDSEPPKTGFRPAEWELDPPVTEQTFQTTARRLREEFAFVACTWRFDDLLITNVCAATIVPPRDGCSYWQSKAGQFGR